MKLHFLCGEACGDALDLCLASMSEADCLVLAGETAAGLKDLSRCPGQLWLLWTDSAQQPQQISSGEAAPQVLDCASFADLCARSDGIICW